MTHLIGAVDFGFVDKRRNALGDENLQLSTGPNIFSANAAGTTSTMVGASAAPGTNNNNVVRRGDKFHLLNAAGNWKEGAVFRVTNIQTDTPGVGSSTVTFTPNAATATANGDSMELITYAEAMDQESLDRRLSGISGYSQATLNTMTLNDKLYALRVARDIEGV